jgi:DtxR family Mn-dependent transcriptional regulator
MQVRTSQAAEDYLKAIYEMTRDGQRASTNHVAEWMSVAPASATGMIQKLAAEQPPLVDYEKHHGVALTPIGERVALEVIRHHRLLETFLQEKLGYTWDEVHEEADRLEHVISEELEERISEVLGNPEYDPHGEPIPTREFHMPVHSSTLLSELQPGSQAVIQSIADPEADLLRYLASLGLTPGAHLTVLDVSPFDDNLTIEIEGHSDPVVLGTKVTTKIAVVR